MKVKISILAGIVIASLFIQQVSADIGTSNTNSEDVKGRLYKTDTDADSSCMGDYSPIMPDSVNLNTNMVTSAEKCSPLTLGQGWYVLDHVGVKDAAFAGERHISVRDGGIQFYGYYAPPYNDMILRDMGGPVTSLNVKQCPVRADWHTVNGSGIVFGASLDTDDAPRELSIEESTLFSGYAFVATLNKIEVREYNNISMKKFAEGSADYNVLYETPKLCNSQSLTVDRAGDIYSFLVGYNKLVSIKLDSKGNFAGAMCDYQAHGCTSLSSVYMFNFTADGVDYFKGDTNKTEDVKNWRNVLNRVNGGK